MPRIYESANLRVVAADRGGDTVVVTFVSMQRAPSLETAPFGLDFFESLGISAFGVIGAGNDWYQYPDMPDALAVIDREAGNRRRVTYGSSMGGYAALAFASDLSAARAVTISPTAAIKPGRMTNRRLVPKAFRDSPESDWRPLERGAGVNVVLYDPFQAMDRARLAQITQAIEVVRVPIPFGGHPASYLLADCGLISQVIHDLVDGTWSDHSQRRMIGALRARRRQCWRFHFNLAQSLPQRRHDLALALLRDAMTMEPQSATQRTILGRALEAIVRQTNPTLPLDEPRR